MVPFRVELPANFAQKWQRSETLPFYLRKGESYHPSDLLGNFLLFLPFGFALQGWRLERRGAQTVSWWPTVAAGMVFSLAIETTQFFLKDRYTSINDWILNVAGTAAGAAGARYYYRAALDRGVRFGGKLLQRPGVLLLLLLFLGYALWMLLPFNFTLATNNMLRKWLQWKFSFTYLAALAREILTLDRREYWPLVILENGLLGVLVGGQFLLCQHWYRPGNSRVLWGGLVLLTLVIVVIASLQLLVIGSNPDALPMFAMLAGLVLMVVAAQQGRSPVPGDSAAEQRFSARMAAGLMFALVLLFVLLLLRPDLPDLRVAQELGPQHGSLPQASHSFFDALRISLQPSQLSAGGSAYFRLFLKLLLLTMALAFALAHAAPHRPALFFRQPILAAVILWSVIAILGQALRFYLWHGSVSLLAVVALALGGATGARLARWWDGFRAEPPHAILF